MFFLAVRILKSKEARKIITNINSHWESNLSMDLDEFVFTTNEKERIQIAKKEAFYQEIKSYSQGIYLGSIMPSGFRLSIEGAQLVGKTAKKNIVDIDESMAKQWMKGEDIFIGTKDVSGHVIIKFGQDYLGSGKYKDDHVLNYVPKARRIDLI
jgi:16S rRNA (cytosine1407-C5)-methyltransferase